MIKIPIITNEYEEFDFRNFDGTMGFNIVESPNGSRKEYSRQGKEYLIALNDINSYFTVIKKFYENGKIKEKGLYFNSGGFYQGIWYYFDDSGKFVRQENFDLPFKFDFNDLFVYLQKQNIPLTIGYIQYGFHTQIYNDVDPVGAKWYVIYLKDRSKLPNTLETLTIDGNSGKILERKYSDLNH